jgi:hypothetical protein
MGDYIRVDRTRVKIGHGSLYHADTLGGRCGVHTLYLDDYRLVTVI